MNGFNGKSAIVTGASGIGAATAEAFARAGASVMLADVQEKLLRDVAARISKAGGKAAVCVADMSREDDIKRMVAETVKAFGRLDCAFNNAGIEGAQGPTHECTNANWDRVIAINLTGVWQCMKHEIPAMLAGGGGAIVNCASIAGLAGFTGIPAYVASKHGVVGLTKGAALEYARQNIRVNAVCPGVIQTPMIDRFVPPGRAARTALLEGEPVGRAGTPDEIASAVLWLCSPENSFTTGQAVAVDGGWMAR
jgi:NAD(P)-dependent dehydrogenase (short-subunit alcohol dehydrogenase family)